VILLKLQPNVAFDKIMVARDFSKPTVDPNIHNLSCHKRLSFTSIKIVKVKGRHCNDIQQKIGKERIFLY